MKILIQTLGGERLEFDLESGATVAAVKAFVQEKLDIAPKQQSLFWEGKALEDEGAMVDSGIVEGAVLNLVVADQNWLELLQKKGIERSDSHELGCNDIDVELVDDAVHKNLLEGKLDEWKSGATGSGRGWKDEYSRTPFEPISAETLLAQQNWIATVFGDRVKEIGNVWMTGYSHSTGSKDWIHKWFVFEFGGHVFRVHDYCMMKG